MARHITLRSIGAQSKRALFLFAVGLLAAAALLPFAASRASALSFTKDGFCVPFKLPVAPAAGQKFSWSLSATYCQPYHWSKGGNEVDVLTAGATYSSMYWDWPQNPSLYSYVDKTLSAGRATLAYDRIGSGNSSHPVSTDITMNSDAYVLHELVTALHLVGYKQVNSIGHSYGSGIAMHEAATYGDVSRVVLTGYLHYISNPAVVAGNYPANQDPRFAGQKLDNGQSLDGGYLTTRPANGSTPAARQTSFYSSTGDPTVIAFDEANKDLVSSTGFGGFFADRGVAAGSNLSNHIKVPVLLMVGQQDAIFCYNSAAFDCSNQAAVKANEAPYYTGASSLSVSTVPNTGHDLALHPSANQSFATINQWVQTH